MGLDQPTKKMSKKRSRRRRCHYRMLTDERRHSRGKAPLLMSLGGEPSQYQCRRRARRAQGRGLGLTEAPRGEACGASFGFPFDCRYCASSPCREPLRQLQPLLLSLLLFAAMEKRTMAYLQQWQSAGLKEGCAHRRFWTQNQPQSQKMKGFGDPPCRPPQRKRRHHHDCRLRHGWQ